MKQEIDELKLDAAAGRLRANLATLKTARRAEYRRLLMHCGAYSTNDAVSLAI
jgi:hypothetical protein